MDVRGPEQFREDASNDHKKISREAAVELPEAAGFLEGRNSSGI